MVPMVLAVHLEAPTPKRSIKDTTTNPYPPNLALKALSSLSVLAPGFLRCASCSHAALLGAGAAVLCLSSTPRLTFSTEGDVLRGNLI